MFTLLNRCSIIILTEMGELLKKKRAEYVPYKNFKIITLYFCRGFFLKQVGEIIMKISKPPLTIIDQISKIKSKNITILNESKCSLFLRRNNYQKLFLYRNLLDSSPENFEELVNLYYLDSEIRNIVFFGLNIIEAKLKTELAYFHVIKYGNHGYMDSDNFFRESYHSRFIKKILEEISTQNSHMIESHFRSYDDDPPLYKIVEILSFGQLSKFYSNLKKDDMKQFSKEYYYRKDIYTLKSWLVFLVEIRNACAHGIPLLNKAIMYPPVKLKVKEWDSIDQKNIAILFYVMKEIIDDSIEFNKMKSKLLNELNSFNSNKIILSIIDHLKNL